MKHYDIASNAGRCAELQVVPGALAILLLCPHMHDAGCMSRAGSRSLTPRRAEAGCWRSWCSGQSIGLPSPCPLARGPGALRLGPRAFTEVDVSVVI